MESTQYDEVMELSHEEKVSLDELIKEAESENIEEQSLAIVADNDGLDKDAVASVGVTVVVGALKNQTKGLLKICDRHKWAGHIVKDYPDPLNSAGIFVMSALSSKGVKAGVVYSGKNRGGVECAWLLAFAHTKDLGRRIYGEVGGKDKIMPVDWDRIERKLNHAGAVVKVNDKETGIGLYATIVGTKGGSAVAAAFTG